MKILVVCYEDMGGNIGGVRQVIEISRHLQKLGHQVEIVAPAIRKYEGEFCGKIRYIPVLWGKFLQPLTYNLTALPVLLTACRELQPDCLLIFEIFSSCAPMLAAKILSLPYAVFVNGDIEDFRLQKFPSIVIWFLERMRHINFIGCKRVFTVSPVLRDSLIKKYAFFPERITVVSNGVDTDLFKPLDRNEALRTLGRSPDYFYIGFVGGMWPWHGLEFLIKSAPAVLEKIPQARFCLAGHGPQKAKLISLIEQWGLKPYFSVEGEIEFGKVPQFINGLDVAILFFKPVRKNPGNPLKLFEYLACGKPVIATDIENYGRLLEHHSAGLAVDSENPVSVAEAILRLARDQELYRRMSAQARQVAVGRFSWKNTALTIESPLKGIIK